MSKKSSQGNTKSQANLKRWIIPFSAVVLIMAGVGLYLNNSSPKADKSDLIDIVVYKSPTCQCCNRWINHLEQAGFNVKAQDKTDMNSVKKTSSIAREFQSCHTAKIGNYFIEGHVPAAEIKKLLTEKPGAKGLAVPGMPMGSPGMEGRRSDKYSVLIIDKNDNANLYASY